MYNSFAARQERNKGKQLLKTIYDYKETRRKTALGFSIQNSKYRKAPSGITP